MKSIYRGNLCGLAISLRANSRLRSRPRHNLRRAPWIRANHGDAGGKFYFFNCDVASLFYTEMAKRLGFTVVLVALPGRNFVRWSSPNVRLNWDPNEGASGHRHLYASQWRVTPQLHGVLIGAHELGRIGGESAAGGNGRSCEANQNHGYD